MSQRPDGGLTLVENHPLATAAALVVGVAFVMGAVWWRNSYFDDLQSPGLLGDSFGVANAAFSGLAFAGVVYAILLQRRDLQLQRSELTQQREIVKKQSFESTFFAMLRLHHDIVAGIDFTDEIRNRTYKGRDCFQTFYEHLSETLRRDGFRHNYATEEERIDAAYLDMYERYGADIGHYFRNLYTLVRFVQESQLDDRKVYMGIIRAQLSSPEHLLLFYNCISPYGRQKFKPLLIEWALLENMPQHRLIYPEHVGLISSAAFGEDRKV